MKKICVSTRDELLVINSEQIAYIEAEGNNSRLYYIVDHKENNFKLPYGISKVEDEIISKCAVKGQFVRIGRSVIINRRYLTKINTYDCEILLSDFGNNSRKLRGLPKPALKKLKELERIAF